MTGIKNAKIVQGCNSKGAWTGMTYESGGERYAAHQTGHWTRAEMLEWVMHCRGNDRNRENN